MVKRAVPKVKRSRAKAPKAPKPAPITPGTVFAAPVHDGRWTAYQVVEDDGTSPAIVALDWLSDALPTLDDLRGVKPLWIDHHNWRGGGDYLHVTPPRPPRRWRALGVVPVVDFKGRQAHGGWPDGFAQIVLQRRWDTEIPAAARAAYKACTSKAPLRVDLGALVLEEVWTNTSDLHLGRADAPIPSGTRLRWEALAPLSRLGDLHVDGDPAGLVEHLVAHPMIAELGWSHHGRKKLDLGPTRLLDVSIGVDGPLALTLPDTVTALTVHGDAGLVTVKQPLRGARIQLQLGGRGAPANLPRGLDRLRALRLWSVGTVDLAPIVDAFPDLEDLSVGGPSTRLVAVERLADLPRLRILTLRACYQLDAAALPPASTWPELDRVDISGHRKSDAAAIRARLGGAPRFELTGGKTDAWLAANLDNPFRDWIDRDRRAGTIAAAAWRKTRTKMDPAAARKTIERLLRAFIAVFNKLDAKPGLDTIDREEIGEAFRALTIAGGIDDATSDRWFDAWRDF